MCDRVAVVEHPLEPRAVEALVAGEDAGGRVVFEGVVRRQSHGQRVLRLEYEAYRPMALRVLRDITETIETRWPGVRCAIHHRVGTLAIGELAVVIAVAAPHRAEAFEACRYAIEALKADVPIWKREVMEGGAVWVGLGP